MEIAEFLNQIDSPKPLLADGAMGTMLHQRGVCFDDCFDQLNLTNPGLVAEIHQEYIEAGAQMIQTNTFGANRYKLARLGMQEQVVNINSAGVELAKKIIASSSHSVLIAGDIGPLGIRLSPFGRVHPEQAHQAFCEQIDVLIKSGVDLIIIETMTDLFEIHEAIKAARELAPNLPIITSMTFTRDDRTLLGDDPAKVARLLSEWGTDVIGINCSSGPEQVLRILRQMQLHNPQARFSVMPNAGWPEQVGGRIMYPAAPEYFGEYALAFWQAGANLIGGCCGTTPQHIAAMSQAILSNSFEKKAAIPVINLIEREDSTPAEKPTRLAQKLSDKKFVIAVEMDPPRGLATQKILAGASLLAEAGADVINVADSPMARMRMSPWAVCNLIQNQVNIETVLHFPTRGRNLLRVQGDLLAAYALGIRNVFIVMGDSTTIGDYPNAMDNFDLVPSGLIKLIKEGFNTGVDQAGSNIGQPTTFFVGCALNLHPSDPLDEIKRLQRKISAGADFILTQPVFNSNSARKFIEQLTNINGPFTVPILVGILPIANSRHAAFLNHEVPGIDIPNQLYDRMKNAGDDSTHIGIEIGIELINQMKPYIQGVYLMPAFNRFDVAAEIIDAIR
ncbi:MAG TPA: bifunctional homocysteine S-methyltransferase/methylenetetrahydrofolate reductase [Anaerolineaceae bacterium]|nr:bifunctional homocysteine S-methyltransferase/methylenetetrahydrofolate reductase [Anaerolineaceae bacterium]